MILANSVLVKGMDIKKELFIFEESYKQYKTCLKANLESRMKKIPAPYKKQYVENALYIHVEAKVTLENFVEYVQNIEELKEDLEMFTRDAKRHFWKNEFYNREVRLLKPFIQSLEEQAYLVPIVVDALRNIR